MLSSKTLTPNSSIAHTNCIALTNRYTINNLMDRRHDCLFRIKLRYGSLATMSLIPVGFQCRDNILYQQLIQYQTLNQGMVPNFRSSIVACLTDYHERAMGISPSRIMFLGLFSRLYFISNYEEPPQVEYFASVETTNVS